MPDPNAVPHAEMQLEVLLRQFLGEDMDDLEPQASGEVPPAVSELADLARRLNAAARDAALASLGGACGARANVIPARRRRPLRPRGRRLQAYPWEWATAAAAVAVGVVGFGLGMMWAGASPSSPWYRARLAVEDIQVALAPSPLARAELLVRNARAHIIEIRTMASAGNTAGLRQAADALDADAGWLHAVLPALPAPEQRVLVKVLNDG